MVKSAIEKLKGFSLKQWLVLGAFVLVLGFTGFQVVRTVRFALYWQDHRDEPIEGWMRIGYVANSYQVPRPELFQAVGLPTDARDRRPLAEIAESQGRSFDEVKAEIERAIREFRAGHPPRNGGGP